MTRLKRRYDAEILDVGELDGAPLDPDVLAHSLGQVEAVDRWLGGERAFWRTLDPLLPSTGPLRILDVGTGNGALLRRVVSKLRRRGVDATGIGVDVDPLIADAAAAETHPADGRRGDDDAVAPIQVIQADGLRLPLSTNAVDVSLAVLTLHHFTEDAGRALLREMARVSTRAVLVSDLERSIPAWIGARLLSATVWRRNPITRHDGPLSVLRAFTVAELAELGGATGWSVRTARHPLFRLTLVATP